jgi:hypothetical protein
MNSIAAILCNKRLYYLVLFALPIEFIFTAWFRRKANRVCNAGKLLWQQTGKHTFLNKFLLLF